MLRTHSQGHNAEDGPGLVVRTICNGSEFLIRVGDGSQSTRWLAVVLSHRVKNDKETHGRLQQRQRMCTNDGRKCCLPIPLAVTFGENREFCDPQMKIKDLLTKYGHDLEFQVQMGFDIKPEEDGGVLLRQDFVEKPKGLKQFRIDNVFVCGDRVSSTASKGNGNSIYVAKKNKLLAKAYPSDDLDNWMEMPSGPSWADLAFNREGRKRYDKYIAAERKIRKLNEIERKKLKPSEGGEDSAQVSEFGQIMAGINLTDLLPLEAGDQITCRTKLEALLRVNYGMLSKIFEHFTFKELVSELPDAGQLYLVDLLHFCLQSKIYGPADEGSERLEEILKTIGNEEREKCIKKKQGQAEQKKAEKTEDAPGRLQYLDDGLPKAKFIESLIRISCAGYRKKNNLKPSNRMTTQQIVSELRQLLSNVIPLFERRNNIKTRRLVSTEEIRSIIFENYEALQQVFNLYGSADANKDESLHTSKHSLNFREFMLLTTDSLLLGECPGDTNEDTQKASDAAFIGGQARDEAHAVNAANLSEAQRMVDGFMPEIVFSEFIEAVVRVALKKWDDPGISNSDKIQLALEAIAVLSQ